MKDGYYLFTYLCIDELSSIAQIPRRTDNNIALFKKEGDKVELILFAELERYTGIKGHSISFRSKEQAELFLNRILSKYHLNLEDMVMVWGTPELETYRGCEKFKFRDENPNEKPFFQHAIFHLFSAVMMNKRLAKNNIIGFAVDGGPDFVNTNKNSQFNYVGCVKQGEKIELFSVYSPGPLWTLAKNTFNMQEGTLMALASACSSKVYGFSENAPLISKSDELDVAYSYIVKLRDHVEKAIKSNNKALFSGYDPNFSEKECIISCVMKEIQLISNRIMEINIENVIEKYGIDTNVFYLALSGGYALNCPCNSYIFLKYGFKGFVAPPCVNDSGISLGMGLYYFSKSMKQMQFELDTAFYGDFEEMDVLEQLKDKYKHHIKSISAFTPEQAVRDIETEPIAWIEGKSEIGPRALGHRSILSDPRFMKCKQRLNEIKLRQPWRPVAPIVLNELGSEWFENFHESPFMLHIFKVKEDKIHLIPAVTHLDKTARVQTVEEKDNGALYQILKEFYKQTEIPILCNTSLNDRGEPIINSLEECINFALRKGMNVIYFNQKRIEIQNHTDFNKVKVHKRSYSDFFHVEDREKVLERLNPHCISDEVLHFYYTSPEIIGKYDFHSKDDVNRLNRLSKYYFNTRKLDQYFRSSNAI